MRCPKCDNKESRLLPIDKLRGPNYKADPIAKKSGADRDGDSFSGTMLSVAILDEAFKAKNDKDGSQIYCGWCGYLVYEDPKEEV